MSTKIEWTEETWNPVTGCTKVSPGCANCYAERMAKRLAGRHGYPINEPFRVTLQPNRLDQPLRWKGPRRVFVCSMSDLFHENVPDEYLHQVWTTMMITPKHTYQILTKRPQRMLEWVQKSLDYSSFDSQPLPNVWIGVTAEDQQRADERIPLLLQIPAVVRFVSAEPMLGSIDLSEHLYEIQQGRSGAEDGCSYWVEERRLLHWIIIGCESGPRRRSMQLQWAVDLVQQCELSDTPVFVKQIPMGGKVSHHIPEWPERLQVRQYPNKDR